MEKYEYESVPGNFVFNDLLLKFCTIILLNRCCKNIRWTISSCNLTEMSRSTYQLRAINVTKNIAPIPTPRIFLILSFSEGWYCNNTVCKKIVRDQQEKFLWIQFYIWQENNFQSRGNKSFWSRTIFLHTVHIAIIQGM
jgi:hypothetical protein